MNIVMRVLIGLVCTAGVGVVVAAPPKSVTVAQSENASMTQIARGQYLTRLGGCKACHTRADGTAFAGGRAIKTPFGVVYSSNITPDVTGLGQWKFADFYRAMHEGLDKNGDYLYPAFPFPNYTKMTRKDVKAIWTYLKTLHPEKQKNRAPDLDWPYSMRSLMGVWRSLYFTAATFKPNPAHDEKVNRGAYLVKAVAHCGACHSPRNDLGAVASKQALAGATVSVDDWYAPNITTNTSTGIGAWSSDEIKSFLRTGRSAHGMALGPMRSEVQNSLQYLNDDDLDAIVAYLKTVPARGVVFSKVKTASKPQRKPTTPLPGATLYQHNCAGCHGDDGHARHAYYPDLKDNSVVLAPNPTNLVLMILRGGFEAATQTHPLPYSMPPFIHKLSDKQIMHIANYVRRNWEGRRVPGVTTKQVDRLR